MKIENICLFNLKFQNKRISLIFTLVIVIQLFSIDAYKSKYRNINKLNLKKTDLNTKTKNKKLKQNIFASNVPLSMQNKPVIIQVRTGDTTEAEEVASSSIRPGSPVFNRPINMTSPIMSNPSYISNVVPPTPVPIVRPYSVPPPVGVINPYINSVPFPSISGPSMIVKDKLTPNGPGIMHAHSAIPNNRYPLNPVLGLHGAPLYTNPTPNIGLPSHYIENVPTGTETIVDSSNDIENPNNNLNQNIEGKVDKGNSTNNDKNLESKNVKGVNNSNISKDIKKNLTRTIRQEFNKIEGLFGIGKIDEAVKLISNLLIQIEDGGYTDNKVDKWHNRIESIISDSKRHIVNSISNTIKLKSNKLNTLLDRIRGTSNNNLNTSISVNTNPNDSKEVNSSNNINNSNHHLESDEDEDIIDDESINFNLNEMDKKNIDKENKKHNNQNIEIKKETKNKKSRKFRNRQS